MKSENKQARNERIGFAVCWAVLAVCVALLVCAASGCASTVAPERIESRQASYDGNSLTSGVIMSTPTGFVVTDNFRERYNALIATYGGDFTTPLKPDAGIAPIGEDRWLITKQAMVQMLEMNAWKRAGLKPKGNK